MTGDWRNLTPAQLDAAYDQRQHAPNMAAVLARLAEAGGQAQDRLTARRRLPYGPAAVEALDWYASGRARAPVVFFVHGGAWRMGQAREYAFFAEWMLQDGVDVVIPDFSAVTDAGGELGQLYRQVSAALALVASQLQGSGRPIHLLGHSSGAHLAACLAADPASPATASLTACSGIYDLEPVSLSSRSSYVNFTAELVQALSPIRHAGRVRVPVTLLCGTHESPEFIRQAQAFHGALQDAGAGSRLVMGEALNHFEVLETLQQPQGWLAGWVRAAWRG